MSIYQGRFAGRTAIITGGASGLGKAVTKRIVAEGGKVAIWDLNRETLASAKSEIGVSHAVALDVSDHAAVERAAADSAVALGKLDILICSAGITGATIVVQDYRSTSWQLSNRDQSQWRFLLLPLRPFPAACQRGKGHRQRVFGGGQGRQSQRVRLFCIQGRCDRFYQVAGQGTGGQGRDRQCIDTRKVTKVRSWRRFRASQIEYMRSRIPMGRLGEVDESAAMICFMASEECSFTTASTFDTSGGRTTF